ncbi:MAG TPA: di-heme-cytochrome C peroxidase [Myxococcaceae bacterium]|nr:di-heme-cytochrome C peroxidase [Myxococcaceae bacterium]
MGRQRFLVVLMLGLAACATVDKSREAVKGFGERAGLVLEQDAYGDGAKRLVYLEQGWGPAETLWFYHADQGSVLMPYDTLVHLEQAGNDKPFLHPEHITRFRLLNQHRTPNNPDKLPVGFARHNDKVGLTCAACHTSQINYQGTAMRIDGAPALANVPGFLREVQAALAATLADEAKLARYAAAVPGGGKGEASREAARQSLTQTLRWFESYNTANHSSTVEGFGRMDAVGRIINQAIRFSSDPSNSIEPNAPTSFPLLWDAPRHDYVQWTGFSPNSGAGSLGRNSGEVVGVFGQVEVKHYKTQEEAKKGYPSTVQTHELVAMEESLRGLKSPQWPEQILPPIDRKLAARGEQLYQVHCVSCHATINRDDPRRDVVAMITGLDVVGTDDTTARNIAEAQVPSGVLEGAIAPNGTKYGARMPALSLVGDLATRIVAANPTAAVKAIANARLNGQQETSKQGNHTARSEANPTADLLAYKARPLNGTWASSPYLHNGSVPTLYDLLLPPAQRPQTFAVGRWEYDPRKVGYVSDGQVPFVFDTRVTGNSNRGHEFGVTLPDADRWALVEYLKTL